MAATLSLMEEHLLCPVCLDIFRNPVVLKCSHSFCEDCLQKYWKNVENLFCPVCRKECSSEEPSLSLALKSLCNSIQKFTEKNKAEHNCQLHGEHLKLFCFDDKQPICVVCHTSKKHKGHDCSPIEEAVPDLKSELQAMVFTLMNKLQNKNAAKITHQNWLEHIKNYTAIHNRSNCISTGTEDTEIVSGTLIDMAKHLGSLKFKVWEKMLEFVDHNPVTLDPNTMSTKLAVNDDLSILKYCDERQNLPNNTERFQNIGVLGSEGFTKGIHFWDVEVGDNDNWILGVAKESIPRKRLVKMLPQSGLWVLRYVSGKYKAGTKPLVQMKLDESPKVIRVQLDCDQGEVTFYDLTRNTPLFTFNDEFPEKVFPYFNTQSHICPLRLLKSV
ncbi:E3 ubiquitin-protein ligase TRIM39 isoform X2 [Esox lucius]|uniref:E3 ubiquitin-protein ligase TRIM39 isoform X2 n=1 Tax=Esox lucius TaxID=8010 RepID=UPI0005774705|nr:E3 ubiquitin-protein ligase TRIM39 isoform X2 [Esox lucius]